MSQCVCNFALFQAGWPNARVLTCSCILVFFSSLLVLHRCGANAMVFGSASAHRACPLYVRCLWATTSGEETAPFIGEVQCFFHVTAMCRGQEECKHFVIADVLKWFKSVLL